MKVTITFDVDPGKLTRKQIETRVHKACVFAGKAMCHCLGVKTVHAEAEIVLEPPGDAEKPKPAKPFESAKWFDADRPSCSTTPNTNRN